MPTVVTVDQPFDASGLYTLRATLAAHASQLGVPGQQIEALLIVASELATNAIRHGGGTGRLRMWRHRSTLHCQVSDRGPGGRSPAEDEHGHAEGCHRLAAAVAQWLAQGD